MDKNHQGEYKQLKIRVGHSKDFSGAELSLIDLIQKSLEEVELKLLLFFSYYKD